ncbi:hypothetical protein BV22DRAFT_1180246 [Leucogyrophana mollusca]|uniref:Uncharacterized protein n=1 Tax=Leucogyrophana mollusca TaxID=85980 RepID=A0ACB8B689_9AGAM|nr:hypothetical protein BV22DRAFT_1180246 [Leucogyrophana mollusca]
MDFGENPRSRRTDFQKFAMAVITSATYDYEIEKVDDPFVTIVGRATEFAIKFLLPDGAAVPDTFMFPPQLQNDRFRCDMIFFLVVHCIDVSFDHSIDPVILSCLSILFQVLFPIIRVSSDAFDDNLTMRTNPASVCINLNW